MFREMIYDAKLPADVADAADVLIYYLSYQLEIRYLRIFR